VWPQLRPMGTQCLASFVGLAAAVACAAERDPALDVLDGACAADRTDLAFYLFAEALAVVEASGMVFLLFVAVSLDPVATIDSKKEISLAHSVSSLFDVVF
jgi:hypothetical protein